jgi:hypothetical protein
VSLRRVSRPGVLVHRRCILVNSRRALVYSYRRSCGRGRIGSAGVCACICAIKRRRRVIRRAHWDRVAVRVLNVRMRVLDVGMGALYVRVLRKPRLRRGQRDCLSAAGFLCRVEISVTRVKADQHPAGSKSRPCSVSEKRPRIRANHCYKDRTDWEGIATYSLSWVALWPLGAFWSLGAGIACVALRSLRPDFTLRALRPLWAGWTLNSSSVSADQQSSLTLHELPLAYSA